MNEIQIFNNEQFGSVRTLTIDNEPWFVGKDIAEMLKYADPQKAIKMHVDEEEKLTRQIVVSGQNRNTTVINESGLYSLILSSKLPTAKQFKHWITSEVLPSIRRHGVYAIDKLLENPDTLITALIQLKEERAKAKALEQTVAVQSQQITEMKPKASYYDIVLQCKDLVPISVIAKDYGWSANHLNNFLHEKAVQFKQGKIWLLYQKYAERGFTNTKTHVYEDESGIQHTAVHTCWTQAGRLFIYDLLKSNDILPLIERAEEREETI